jgi:choline-sulfatase
VKPSASSTRPNILFLFSDQHRADALGCAGHAHVRTPNLDKLAATGTRFTRAYAAAPICHPCRSALMTGRQVHRCCDLTTSEQLLDLSLPTMGSLFRQGGYVTAAFGKMHVVGEDEEHDLGFDERALRIYTPMHNDYQHTIGLEKFWQYCSYLPRYKPHPDAQPRHSYNLTNKPIQLEEDLILDHMTTDRSIGFLRAHRSEPFFLYVGLEKPHNEMYAPKRFHDLYEPARMELPENRNFDRSRLPDTIYDNPSFPIADGLTDDQMHHATAAYFANISYMDEQAGRVLDALDELGLHDNTIVVYSTDHGEHLFNHQMVHKMCFFEEAVRVPLILRIPGVTDPGSTRDQFAGLLDLLPTFCDACGIAPPEGLDGKSLLPAIADNAPTRDALFSEYYSAGTPERMIRTNRWKYVHSHGDRHQLYDLENDPHENVNLIDDPAHAATAAELDARVCRDWVLPDMSRVPRKRGDTRPGQRSCRETVRAGMPE